MTTLTALPDILQLSALGDSLTDGSYLDHATAEGGGGSWMEHLVDEIAAFLGRPVLTTGNIGQLSQPARWSRSAGFTFAYSSKVATASVGANTGTLTTLDLQRASGMSNISSGSVMVGHGANVCTISFTGKSETQLTGCVKTSGASFVLAAGDIVVPAATGTTADYIANAPFGCGWFAAVGGATVIETFTRPSYWRTLVGVQVTFQDISIGTQMWRYRLDGGSWQTPTITLAKNNTLRSFYIPNGFTSTIEFQAFDGSVAVPMWVTHVQGVYIDPRTPGVKGVICHNYGINGWRINDATCVANVGDRLAVLDSVVPDPVSGAISCTPNGGCLEMFLVNEVPFADATAFAAQLTVFYNRTTPLGPVAFIAPHEVGGGTSSTQDTYRTQKASTATTLGAKFYNLFARYQADGWGGVGAQAVALGTAGYLGDFVHFAQPGHNDFGNRSGWFLIDQFLSGTYPPVTNAFQVGDSGVSGTDVLGGTSSPLAVGVAAGTGTAYDARTNVGPAVGVASGTGQAFDAKTSVSPAAGVASGTGAALSPAPSVAPNAGVASGTGTAYNAQASPIAPTAGAATGTGTAFNASTSVASTAGAATGVGTAYNGGANVGPAAGVAAGTGTAYPATTTGTTTAGVAAGTGQAFNASVSVAEPAGAAAGTGTAYNAAGSVGAAAGNAAGTGVAFNASTSSSTAIDANADVAAGVGQAYGATISIAPQAGLAAGTGAAFAATTSAGATTGVAAGTGAAFAPSVSVATGAGVAAGVGTAYQPSAVGHISPTAGNAAGTGAAFNARVSVGVAAGAAAGTGAAYPATTTGTVSGPPTTATVTVVGTMSATVSTDGDLACTVS